MKNKHFNSMRGSWITTYLFAAGIFFSLTSCGTPSAFLVAQGVYEVRTGVWTQKSYDSAKEKAYEIAKTQCRSLDRSMEVLFGDFAHVGTGLHYVLRFKCYDDAARAEEQRKKMEAARLLQEKDAAERAERIRQENLKAELEAKRAAEEWERTRPAREAAERRRQLEEQNRLNAICPGYWVARQLCATAPDYGSCMRIRIGKTYSSSDDSDCYQR